MDGMTTWLPRSRPLTRADLDALREEGAEDGHRYELIDGVLVVTPSPSREHQQVLGRLFMLLSPACPDDQEVLFAPFDVTLSDDTVMQPDLLVARREDFTSRDLPTAPLLAVEVLSPSTRRFDLTLKRSRYEAARAGSYWVVDPIEVTLTAWDLVDGRYVQVADVRGEEPYEASRPFPVTVVPAQLRD
jgi:Uma2 family endonuclease